jgi:aspartyl-tRNA(Asn)/glutamyl-tRNA(Gln) amidotransferase subunit A
VTSELASLTIADAAPLIAAKKVSPVELTRGYLDRIRRYDGHINSYLLVTEELALKQAREAEHEITAGRYRGPMHGVPYALKDNIETAGITTTAHSKVLRNNIPAADAAVAARLRAAGAVLLGKLACLEFAHASPTPDQAWPPARNPWNTAHGFTGGSSTGSAAAVAASLTLGAIGTDTGGSVRNPAALCGIAGLMPTYGRVSRRGVIPYSFSLDHVGPLAWTAQDCALMLHAIGGFDPEDPGSVAVPSPDLLAGLRQDLRGVRVGWVRHWYEEDMSADAEIRAAMRETAATLGELGANVEEITALPLEEYHHCKLIISVAEFYAVHESEFASRFEEYGADLKTKTFQGAFISASDYIQAQRQRRKLAQDMARRLAPYDVLLTAANFRPAPRADATRGAATFFQNPNITAIFNVTANPAISVCNGFSSAGLPLACQIAAKPFDEVTLLQVAHAYEQATSWHKRRPALTEALAA